MAVLDEIKHPWIRGWIEYGKRLAVARGEARALLLLLDARGLDAPIEARERILACTDQDVLESWICKAVTIESTDELFD